MDFFDQAYEGTPPWEIGRPQREFVSLEERGEIRGRVLDVGCGTGENALYYAARGHRTWGIDFAPRAIQRANEKNTSATNRVHFEVASALDLEALDEQFDTVTDCGIFHTFLDPHRPEYSASVASALRPGGRLYILCFSEQEPTDWGGPRRVTQSELRSTFSVGWKELEIRAGRFETTRPEITGRAWLAAFERLPSRRAVRARSLPPKRPGRDPPKRGSASSARPTSSPPHVRHSPRRPQRAN